MELSLEDKKKIEDLAMGLKCSKDFQCAKSGFNELCEAKDIGFDKILVCSNDNQQPCSFKAFIGDAMFCTCPLRTYIAKNLDR